MADLDGRDEALAPDSSLFGEVEGAELERAYGRVLRLLRYRPRSISEVERYLARHGVSRGVAAKVVVDLVQAGLLDDHAFAQFWVAEREALNPKGVRALRYELRHKGLAGEAILEALRGLDEKESAYRLARSKEGRLAHLGKEEFLRRLGGYLSRRGFGPATVRAALERLVEEQELQENGESEGEV